MLNLKKFLVGLFMTHSFTALAAEPRQEIRRAAKEVGVPPDLLSAICYAESHHKVKAYVHADGTGDNHAFGVCQVLLETAEQFGFRDERCRDDFTDNKERRTYSNCKLFGPYTNAFYAAKYLKYQLDRYNNSWIYAVASYNTGSLKMCRTGWIHNAHGKKMYRCKQGGIINQVYIDRVMHALEEGR